MVSASSLWSVRVNNLPPGTTSDNVRTWFNNRAKQNPNYRVENPGNPCTYAGRQSKTTVVSFASEDGAKQALSLSGQEFLVNRFEKSILNIDTNFLGLTTVYSSPKGPNIDIVAVHGLGGHAWASFTRIADGKREVQWLRDFLPDILEQQGIHPRIMVYGYNSNLFVKRAMVDVTDPAGNLLVDLKSERGDCPDRPLAFIAHSLGGIVVKQMICELIDERLRAIKGNTKAKIEGDTSFINPIRGCLFFGVPHEGSASAASFYPLLKLLDGIIPFGGGPSTRIVKDLRPQSDKLPEIQDRFGGYRGEFAIEVMSCWETQQLSGRTIVTKQSAILEYPYRPQDYAVNATHTDMVRVANEMQPGFMPIMNAFADIIKRAMSSSVALDLGVSDLAELASNLTVANDEAQVQSILDADLLTPWEPPQPSSGDEDVYALLRDYDTVILVDDSGSMAGGLWNMASKALAQLARRAVYYDKDGIDIHFFNATEKNRENVQSAREVVQLFQQVRPNGTTPTYSRLHAHLMSYLRRFQKDPNIKKYNIIILTDGPPDDNVGHIQKLIVQVAKKLENELAEVHQVGIQFVQLGNDPEAEQFFSYIDDHIMKDNKLDRDMVDTTRFNPNLAGEDMFKKILLGAIREKYDNMPFDTLTESTTQPLPLAELRSRSTFTS